MPFSDDPDLASLLAELGITADTLLGQGGEASVYAVGNDRVVRVLHPGGSARDLLRRQRLVEGLRRSPPLFALPDIIEIGESCGRVYAIERRLRGPSVLDTLASSTGSQRRKLILRYLDTASALGDLHLEPHDGFGDLVSDDPVTSTTWRGYLVDRAAANLARSTRDFGAVDPGDLADDLPEAMGPAFVHLDAFAGNMLTDGSDITAVIDFGPACVVGDRRFNPLCAAVYLASPVITPTATSDDIDVAMSWLRTADLHELFDPARRWLAAYWSFAVDHPNLLEWCRDVLLQGA